MTHRCLAMTFAMLALAVAGCGSDPHRNTRHDIRRLEPIVAAVAKADSVVVYEGLPHGTPYEKERGRNERRTKATINVHDHDLYADAIDLNDEDERTLRSLIVSDGAFYVPENTGPKACGGFHPDFCLEWHVGAETYQMLLCFTCHEARMYGPTPELYCDIAQQAYDRITSLLDRHRREHPTTAPAIEGRGP